MIVVTPTIRLDEAEVQEGFMRSSGAGGQNIQKVETAVQLRFSARLSPNMPPAVQQRLERLAGRRLGKDGFITLTAQRFRTQDRNRTDARERLCELIRQAAEPPPPARRPTRPTLGSKRRRLEGKKARAVTKAMRQSAQSD